MGNEEKRKQEEHDQEERSAATDKESRAGKQTPTENNQPRAEKEENTPGSNDILDEDDLDEQEGFENLSGALGGEETIAYTEFSEDEVPIEGPVEDLDILEDEDETSLDVPMDEAVTNASIQESPTGYVMADIESEDEDTAGRDEPLTDEEMDDDYIEIGTNDEAVIDQIDDYTADEDVIEDFKERQQLTQGSDQLLEKLEQHHSRSPELSGDDIDASWDSADQSGEESVGGTVPTPDQDMVDELGDALGIMYEDDEPLDTAEKLAKRDRDRWELNPESARENEEENEEDEEEEDEEKKDWE